MTGDGAVIVFYLNAFLTFGVALRYLSTTWVLKRLSQLIPYTVLLLVIGVLLGLGGLPSAYDEYAEASGSGSVSASGSAEPCASGSGRRSLAATGPLPRREYLMAIKAMAEVDPHTLLYIFLPALLFESAQVRGENAHRIARDAVHTCARARESARCAVCVFGFER